MGRLEKQIIVGALGLVGLLLAIVVLKGLKPRQDNTQPLIISLDDETPGEGAPDGQPEDSSFKPLGPVTPKKDEDKDGGKLVIQPPVTPKKDDPVKPKMEPAKPQPRLYTIQEGDILGRIAEKQLGSSRHVEELMRANPGINEKHLVPGETLVLPVIEAKQSPKETPGAQASGNARTHTVAPGDSLWKIAEKYYQDGSQLKRIVSANPTLLRQGEDSVLKVGMSLVIPR